MRTMLITGAAGHLGSTIIRELRGVEGLRIRGLVMKGQRPPVTGEQISYVEGDVTDRDSLQALFADIVPEETIVIHTAAVISIASGVDPALYRVNVNGTKNVLSLCEAYKVRRLVHVSSVHAIPPLPGNAVMTEPDHFSPDLVEGGYAMTKAEAAQAVLDAARYRGLDAVIVLPSGILGPYDLGNNHLVQMCIECMEGKLPGCVDGGYDFVDVRDVAEGCILAAGYGRAGESYILSGHYMKIRDLLDLIAEESGQKRVPVLPMEAARLAVPLIDLYARAKGIRPLYTAYSLKTLVTDGNFSNEKAVRELGYTARPMEDTVRDMVRWLQSRGAAGTD